MKFNLSIPKMKEWDDTYVLVRMNMSVCVYACVYVFDICSYDQNNFPTKVKVEMFTQWVLELYSSHSFKISRI